ncbi:MAG: 4Fe-4S dicluster domain-containing protein [Sedimentisphaerales bacterium]|nr:4Fe-4S dicluster domain-containing protein [Sedimentisphaerales bacterium]
MSKIIVIDIEECMACRTCEIECSLVHSKSNTLEEALNEVEPRVNVEGAQEFAVPLQCRHCENAPCIKICPTHAIRRENPDSPVLIDQERCIGCNFCLAVCPFGSISPSYDGHRVVKCDLCFERLNAGQEPACVSGCPTGALKFIEAEQYAHGKRTETAEELASSIQQNKSKK